MCEQADHEEKKRVLVTVNDILGGRGRHRLVRAADQRFHEIISEYAVKHVSADGRWKMSSIQSGVLAGLPDDSRFVVDYDKESNTGRVLSKKDTRQKIGQAIRYRIKALEVPNDINPGQDYSINGNSHVENHHASRRRVTRRRSGDAQRRRDTNTRHPQSINCQQLASLLSSSYSQPQPHRSGHKLSNVSRITYQGLIGSNATGVGSDATRKSHFQANNEQQLPRFGSSDPSLQFNILQHWESLERGRRRSLSSAEQQRRLLTSCAGLSAQKYSHEDKYQKRKSSITELQPSPPAKCLATASSKMRADGTSKKKMAPDDTEDNDFMLFDDLEPIPLNFP